MTTIKISENDKMDLGINLLLQPFYFVGASGLFHCK